MATLLLSSGVTRASEWSSLYGRGEPLEPSSPSEPQQPVDRVTSTTAARRQQQPQHQPQPQRWLRNRNDKETQQRQRSLKNTHPFLPAYGSGTCNNNRRADPWETPHAFIEQCCVEFFGWDAELCVEKYNEIKEDDDDDDDDYDDDEDDDDDNETEEDDADDNDDDAEFDGCTTYQRDSCPRASGCIFVKGGKGCVSEATINDDEDEDVEDKKKKKKKKKKKEVVHPYFPNYEDGTCYNIFALMEWETGYNSLKKCCGSNFKNKMTSCLKIGGDALVAETMNPFLPNYATHSCNRDREAKDWEESFDDLATCCGAHFDWKLDTCLGRLEDEDGKDDDDILWDPNKNNNDDLPTGIPGKTYWHPFFAKGHCVTNHDVPPPAYMQNEPEVHMQTTYRECCQVNFVDEPDVCLEISEALAPPTRPPAVDNGDMTIVKGVDYDQYYFPKYTENMCGLGGDDAPRYMRRDPMSYFTLTASECCMENFPTEKKACVRGSPKKPGMEEEDLQKEADDKVFANPAKYKYHFYPSFGKISCLKNTSLDAPTYMLDSPNTFFFLGYDECCSVSFDMEYADCRINSKRAEIELPYGADFLDDAPKEPHILIKFTGKLYFRNVFIPNSPGNVRIIRDAVLHAVKVSLDGFSVVRMEGTSFDGIDLLSLDDVLSGRRQLRSRRSEGQQQQRGLPEIFEDEMASTDLVVSNVISDPQIALRKLNRMQLYRFTMATSQACDRSCAIAMNSAGRSASMDISELFDDSIADNTMFIKLSQDMEGMGLVGPFFSASLEEGHLQYDGVEWDSMYTWAPTFSPKPTPFPTRKPVVRQRPTSKPSRRPIDEPTDRPTKTNPYYPDVRSKTCKNDGRQDSFQFNLYDSLEECCQYPWLNEGECMVKGMGGTMKPTIKPTRNPTPSPTAPAPTELPTEDPTKRPTEKPTRKPSRKPVSNSQGDLSGWPTFTPTTFRPTPATTCTGNGWHLVREAKDGCTNDDDISDSWLLDDVKDDMFFPTPEECCDEFFDGRVCEIYDSCGELDGYGGATSYIGGSGTDDSDGSGTDDNDGSGTDESDCTGWHVNQLTNIGCTDDSNIPESWLTPELKEKMIYPTSKSCCDRYFPDSECEIVDTSCGTVFPIDPNKDCTGHYGWHVNRVTNDGCSDNDDFVEGWLQPQMKDRMFFPTSDACCDHFFSGEECKLFNVGCGAGGESPAAPTPADSPKECVHHEWHVDKEHNDGCSNDSNIVQAWLKPELKSSMIHPTSKACCDTFFPGVNCEIYDICVEDEPDVSGDPPCISHGWHVDLDKNDGCSNNDNVQESWLDPRLKDRMILPTSKACCDTFFGGKKCEIYDIADSGCGDDKPPVPGDPSCISHGWHVDLEKNDGCSNDGNVQEAWLVNPGLKDRMLLPTSKACCDQFFAGKECEVYDIADSGCGDDKPPVPGDGPADPSCISHGWHVERESNDGCTNDDNVSEAWLVNPELKDRMFTPTAEACCDKHFSGRECKVHTSGCSLPSAPVPTPAPLCVSHGWHIHRNNNDGCTDNDVFPEAWASTTEMQERWFYPTVESCCDRFYFGQECKTYDTGCFGSDINGDSGSGGPGPSITPDDAPSSTSATGFSEDFEGGDLSKTLFTTTSSLPWKIVDDYAYEGSKSVTNSLTGQGQASELKLSMDFPTEGALAYELRHDVYMPWAIFEVSKDGEYVAGYPNHQGDAQWGSEMIPVTKGLHEIVWRVLTKDDPLPPVGKKGTGFVWIDHVRFYGALSLDFEDEEFDDIVSFSGMGKWRIDDSQPGASEGKTGMAAHSPKGLLPGEHSTMEIRYTSPSGGMVSSDIHLAMGTISFYVDGNVEYTTNRPAGGTTNVEVAIDPGEHTFSWKYEPPGRSNLPMSMVWVDNIKITM